MDYITIQDTIAERITKLAAECDAIDLALDLDNPNAQQLHNRRTRFGENLYFLQTIGFLIASQESELETLRLKSSNDDQRIAYLRGKNASLSNAANAANAVTNLLQMERNRWNNAFIEDLEKVFDAEEMTLIIPQLQKQAA